MSLSEIPREHSHTVEPFDYGNDRQGLSRAAVLKAIELVADALASMDEVEEMALADPGNSDIFTVFDRGMADLHRKHSHLASVRAGDPPPPDLGREHGFPQFPR